MSNRINVDFTAVNMNGQGSFSASFHGIQSKEELAEVQETFEEICTFRKFDTEAYAEHEDGSDLTEEEKAWFDELGINL